MRAGQGVVILPFVALVSARSGMTVTSDYDTKADFSAYRSYAEWEG